MGTRGGFTVVEMALCLALTGVVGGVFMLTTQTTSSAVSTGLAVAELDAQSVRVLGRVCDPLKSASSELATPQAVAPFSGTTLDFQRGLGAQEDGSLLLGPLERFVLEYTEADDGADDDGDGLVDECDLVWLEDPDGAGERRMVLAHDVREYGEGETLDGQDENGNGLIDERGFALDFDEEGRWVRVLLTLEGRDSRGVAITSSAERTIAFRNIEE